MWTERVLERLTLPDLPEAWVVGGAVRDALLGREPRELDLVVEGDAIAAARRIGPPTAVHERFGTATVGDTDVAAARTESYARPGALPDVRLGATVEEDLARRDFTINALAVRIGDGRGAEFPGSLKDLEDGVLRVLHDGSFTDDPTRLFRLVRYAHRLGFEPDERTAELAQAAVDGGALDTVSGSRIGAELRLLAAEDAIPALERFGLGRAAIHPRFAASEVARAAAGVGGAGGRAAFGAALVDAEGVDLKRFGFPAAEERAILAAAAARDLARRLQAATRPSEIAAAARDQPPEALAVAAALGAHEPVRRWNDELSEVKLAIDGNDLLAAGLDGPAVGEGLRRALDAALDGEAPDREAQLRAALA